MEKQVQTVTITYVNSNIDHALALARKAPLAVETDGQVEFVILSAADYYSLTQTRTPRQAGYARQLFEGVDVDALLATSIPGLEHYMPD